jgi:putative endopeptidase
MPPVSFFQNLCDVTACAAAPRIPHRFLLGWLGFAAAVAVVPASTNPALTVAKPTPAPPRFKIEYLDRSVDPRADFARFAFGTWLKTNPIPADKSRWGGFSELAQFNLHALRGILDEIAARPHPPGSIEQKVGDFYASAIDTAAIDAAGINPLADDLARIDGIATPDDLARVLAELHAAGGSGLFRVGVSADRKESARHALYASQGGLSLPSRDYYFADAFAKQREAFIDHVEKLLTLAGADLVLAKTDAALVLALEKAFAAQAKTPAELRDALANYHKMPAAELAALVPAFPLQIYLEARGLGGPEGAEIIVGQPEFFRGLQEQLGAQPLPMWKIYLRYHTLAAASLFLAAPFEQEVFRFHQTVLRGTPAMEPRWQRATRATDAALGEALGRLYVARYYPPAAHARMDEMIANIRAVMRGRLETVDWMTETTRQKVLEKFDRFVARIGHPETWRDYSGVAITRENYFSNIRAATRFESAR